MKSVKDLPIVVEFFSGYTVIVFPNRRVCFYVVTRLLLQRKRKVETRETVKSLSQASATFLCWNLEIGVARIQVRLSLGSSALL